MFNLSAGASLSYLFGFPCRARLALFDRRESHRMKLWLWPLLLSCAALAAGCASLPGARTERLGGQQVEYALAGQGTPVVVFENGLGGRLDWWAKVLPEVAWDATAFAYNRPGMGDSAPPATPRDGDHVVEELRAVLSDLGLRPPYVLVGHSLGGLYMQLYARRHPDEVAALVLVDSTHPAQLQGAGAREHWPLWVRAVIGVTTNAAAKAELDALDATGQAVLALPPPAGLPVYVLSAERPLRETSALAGDANAKRRDLVRLYPGARQIWVDSGHVIPLEKPEAVIEAIREAVQANRSVASAPTDVQVR